MKRALLMLGMAVIVACAYGQEVELSATCLSSSELKDKAGGEYGKGGLRKYQAKLVFPLPIA